MSETQEQYDNTHRGALFSIGDNQMEGPFHLETNDDPDTRALLTIDPESDEHQLAVYKVGAQNQRVGKPIAKGTVRATRATGSGENQPPVARGVLRVKGGDKVKLCLWFQSNEVQGEFYQLAPDTFEPSRAPSLANA